MQDVEIYEKLLETVSWEEVVHCLVKIVLWSHRYLQQNLDCNLG